MTVTITLSETEATRLLKVLNAFEYHDGYYVPDQPNSSLRGMLNNALKA